MKKIAILLIVALLLVAMMTACQRPVDDAQTPDVAENSQETEGTTELEPQTLEVWSFTNQTQIHCLAFEAKNPHIDVNFTLIPMSEGEYQTKLRAALATDDAPDVFATEAGFVREYIESDFVMDLTDMQSLSEAAGTYQYTLDVGTYDGQIKGYADQAAPGLVYYRRSLATEYFGTDDPAEVQALLADMDKFMEAAEVIKTKSEGNTYIVPSARSLINPYLANRTSPWVVDGKLNVDEKVVELFENAKILGENGYEAKANPWSEGWKAGMSDSLVDAAGNAKQIFAYFLPTWGVKPIGKNCSEENNTDWAVIPGPLSYSAGGTWYSVPVNTEKADLAKDFISFVCFDEEHQTNFATGVYTNEYLKSIDDSIGDELVQNAGSFMSSQTVVDKIKDTFGANELLGGQIAYAGYADAALTISAEFVQATDFDILKALEEPLNMYASGEIETIDEAIQMFKDNVKNTVPDVMVD